MTTTEHHRQPLATAAAWQPVDIASIDEWTIELNNAERDEIAHAARTAARRGAAIRTLRLDEFELPTLRDRVGDWSELLHAGRGFVLLRRFPIDLLEKHEIELAYLGLGLHLGTPVGQNADGDILGHVRDERLTRRDVTVRLYRTRERQDFHTDGADLVGLLCLHGAKRGGESRIASSAAVYNEILARRPDLLDVLYEPFYWDRHGEESAGESPFFALAPIKDIDGVPRVFYIGWHIRNAQRHADVPRLSGVQIEAMELVEHIANDPHFHIGMDFQPGDIQLLNNAKILHAREEYEDYDDPDRRRHLLRLWLAAHNFTSVEEGLRGGIRRRTS